MLEKILNNKKYLLSFFSGQILLQAVTVLNGFFLLRWLNIDNQAKYSFGFSIQCLIVSLSDFGFHSSIISLVGNRISDKELIGKYVFSALKLRNFLIVFASIIVLSFIPYLVGKHSWYFSTIVLMMIPVLLAIYWQADFSIYSSPLLIHKEITYVYRVQVIIAILKLLSNWVLHNINELSYYTIFIINALSFLGNSYFFKKKD